MAVERSYVRDVAGAALSTQRLRAWPSLSLAAQMLGVSLSALSRAMDAQGIVKHRLGRRSRRIAPVAVLDLAVQYGADIAAVADELMSVAERSGADQHLVVGVEQDIGAWFAGNALQAPGSQEDELARVLDAMRETIGAQATNSILHRAGLSGRAAATSAAMRDAQIRARTGPDPELAGLAEHVAGLPSQLA